MVEPCTHPRSGYESAHEGNPFIGLTLIPTLRVEDYKWAMPGPRVCKDSFFSSFSHH